MRNYINMNIPKREGWKKWDLRKPTQYSTASKNTKANASSTRTAKQCSYSNSKASTSDSTMKKTPSSNSAISPRTWKQATKRHYERLAQHDLVIQHAHHVPRVPATPACGREQRRHTRYSFVSFSQSKHDQRKRPPRQERKLRPRFYHSRWEHESDGQVHDSSLQRENSSVPHRWVGAAVPVQSPIPPVHERARDFAGRSSCDHDLVGRESLYSITSYDGRSA